MNQRILIIDDSTDIHEDYRKILAGRAAPASSGLAASKAALFGDHRPAPDAAPRFQLEFASQGQEGLERLKAAAAAGKPFAVAFVDMRMPPGWNGLETIRNLWAMDPELQVVISTAYSDHTWNEITRTLGLTDRLLILRKPFDPIEVTQLATALSEKWTLQQRASLKTEELERRVDERTRALQHAATHDRLTGLPNRAALRERLIAAIERRNAVARAPQTGFAVLFLDFDRFKVVNDSLGHEAGDALLTEISRRLTSAVKAEPFTSHCSDALAARLGGDEFVILLEGVHHPESIPEIADALLTTLAAPCDLKGHSISPTASIGITTSELDYQNASDVLRDADNAMYHAKSMGKARAVVFDRAMHEAAKARLCLEAELRGVADRGELLLHFQPLVVIESGALRGFEALVRWNHPERGVVPPDGFIPCAEDTGAIMPLGRWVMLEACAQAARWAADGRLPAGATMSVNVSARQLATPQIVDLVKAALNSTGLPASTLALEITESAVITDADAAISTLNQIRAMGVRIHLDDFGIGNTSLSYLHRLPIDALKLDRSFMRVASERRDHAAVVHAVITLAHNLNIEVIAEGIERLDQAAMLRAMDCDTGQGFLFGRPVGAPEAAAYCATPWRAAA